MMRSLMLLLIVSSASASVSAPIDLQKRTQPSAPVDPIVTGKSISKEHMAKWQAQKALSIKCPTCGMDQPFPGD